MHIISHDLWASVRGSSAAINIWHARHRFAFPSEKWPFDYAQSALFARSSAINLRRAPAAAFGPSRCSRTDNSPRFALRNCMCAPEKEIIIDAGSYATEIALANRLLLERRCRLVSLRIKSSEVQRKMLDSPLRLRPWIFASAPSA